MAKQVINDFDSGLSSRAKINANFDELYAGVAAETPTVAASTLPAIASTRIVGDASFAIPVNAKYYWQSAGDGQAFRVGTDDFIAMWRMYPSVKPTDSNTAVTDLDIWPVSFGRDVNNHLAFRYRAFPTNTIQCLWKVGGVNFIDVSQTWTEAGSVSGTAMCVVRKTGETIKIGVVLIDPLTGLMLKSNESTYGSGTLDLDSLMSTTGRLMLNARYPGATPEGCALSSFFMASVPAGTSWADVELDTDEQLIAASVDPSRLAAFVDDFSEIRSFDLCDSAGNRQMLRQRTEVVAGDKLVCLHSDVELTGTQNASPTATPLGCAPYETASQGASLASSPQCRPLAVGVESKIVGTIPGGHIANNQDARLTIWDRDTGYRDKPDIPLIPVCLFADASDSDTVKTIYGWGDNNNLGDNHTQYSTVYDSVNDRIVVFGAYHSEVLSTDDPDTGDTWYSSGWVAIYSADGVVQVPMPYAESGSGSLNATSYGAAYAHTDGNVYCAIRAGGTADGQQRLLRVNSAGVVDFQNYTTGAASNPTGCKAAIPEAIVPVGNYLAITHGTRISGSEDYVGVAIVLIDPEQFDSATSGWYKSATGEDFASTKSTLRTSDPDIYPIPGPGKSALEAYAADATPIDQSTWAYGEAPQGVFSYGDYVGVLTRRGADADRGEAYLQFGQWMLHVLELDGTSLIVTASHDLTALLDDVAGDFRADVAGGATVKDYEYARVIGVTRGTKSMDVYTLRSDGLSVVAETVGTNAINAGTSLGKIRIADWTNPGALSTTVGPLFASSNYGGYTMLAFGVQKRGLLIQSVPSGAVVRVPNAAEAASVFEVTK